MKKENKSYQLKLFFLALWVVFTSAMVVWWWFYGLSSSALDLKHNRMLMWEGLSFLAAILTAGFCLYYFIKQDILRHNKLKVFFSNFSHDIKTSITRLRLQSEVLQDEKIYANDEKFKNLIQDISRLDLQLENSLYIAQEDDYQVFNEKIKVSELIQNIRGDFSEIGLTLEKDCTIEGDKRLFSCVLRNIISNSLIHGHASEIYIKVLIENNFVTLTIGDNGDGTNTNTRGHGIGLNLCHQLVSKMNGSFKIINSGPCFTVSIRIKGNIV